MNTLWTWLTKPAVLSPKVPLQREEEEEEDFCAIRKTMDRQPKCRGCRRIEALMRYCDEHLPPGSRPRPVRFHNSFRELDACAAKCATCRLIRRGLLLNQATVTQVDEELLGGGGGGAHALQVPVWATMETGRGRRLRVSLRREEGSFCPLNKQVELCLSPSDDDDNDSVVKGRSLPTLVSDDRVCAEIRGWARACESHHTQCGNLNWSRKNPTRLIQILSDTHIRIVDARDVDFVPYVALSYCWGSTSSNSWMADTRTVKANISERKNPFPLTDLRTSIQHAIVLVRRVGLRFLWVDSVCIVQDSADDWEAEAMLMAEVYSNAHFTLCSVLAEHADAALIRPRGAWAYPAELCSLAGRRLSIASLPLNALKQLAAYSTRAWTLQEEMLSPRILYWAPQRMYWSCATRAFTESSSFPSPSSASSSQQRGQRLATGEEAPSTDTITTQSFLRASFGGADLHPYWKDVAEDYTKRSLANPEDRFPALSGLAARYQSGGNDKYLAGLWQQTIAEDLAWRVEAPVPRDRLGERVRGIPSWSWASLPICISVKMSRNWQHCDAFSFVGSRSQMEDLAAVRKTGGRDPHRDASLAEIRKGAQVAAIIVHARMRPLLTLGHGKCSWSDVVSQAGQDEQFSFERLVDRHIYCFEPSRSQVLAYEPHRREVVYQLDHLVDDEQLMSRIGGFQCLELGAHCALLIAPCEGEATASGSIESYQRVGISIRLIRPDFFNDVATKTCCLLGEIKRASDFRVDFVSFYTVEKVTLCNGVYPCRVSRLHRPLESKS
ncbi:heterokaryon incompatibility protein-domain-containing protein [Nemania serpens]|nr:heterokaryon incompatibility protein-domain-containing protein [Nemania serpens]